MLGIVVLWIILLAAFNLMPKPWGSILFLVALLISVILLVRWRVRSEFYGDVPAVTVAELGELVVQRPGEEGEEGKSEE